MKEEIRESWTVLLIERILKSEIWRQRKLANALGIADSAIRRTINREVQEAHTVRPKTKRRYEAAINELLQTSYTFQELFSPIPPEEALQETKTEDTPQP